MYFNVPQFIEIEDKIAFQLTAKQLGWFALGGVILFFIWRLFTQEVFFVALIIVPLICSVFAFLKLYGLSFATFLFFGIKFLFSPKRLVWKNFIEEKTKEKKKKVEKKPEGPIKIKKKDLSNIKELAELLDKSFRF